MKKFISSILFAAFMCLIVQSVCAEPVTALPIKYSLPRDGQVSVVITNNTGQIVRELLHGAARKKGPNSEAWDGLNEAGQPVPAGNYTWKLLSTQGLKAEYLLTLGTNPTPRWDSWVGNHGGVAAVTVDEDGAYFSGGSGENTPVLVKQTLDGEKRLWDIPTWLEAWAGGVALDSMGGKVWMFSGAAIWRIDKATGKPEKRFDVRWDGKDESSPPPLDWASRNMDMAAGKEQIVVSYTNHNAIRWFDAEGKVLDEATVPAPLGVTIAPDGRVLAISNDTVVAFTRENKTPQVIVEKGLQGAYRLAADPKTGDILVAERGKEPWTPAASSQQVKKYSASGKFLRAYGTKGGRAWSGAYDPMGFAAMCDIATDGAGGFFIVEDTSPPRRAARVDSAGKLVREWYGGQMYANFGAVDPADPSDVWIDSQWGSLIHAKVDYVNKTWKVAECYFFQGGAEGLIGNTTHGGQRWYPRRHNGVLYLAREGAPMIVRVDAANRRLVPLVVGALNIVVPWNADPWGGQPQWLKDMLDNDLKTPTRSYMWMDLNNDGKPQKEEMNFSPYSDWLSGITVDEDFSYYANIHDYKTGSDSIYKWAVQRWTKEGLPIYPAWDKPEKLMTVPADAGQPTVWKAEDGSYFGAANTNNEQKFGVGWWGARTGGNRVVKWDKTGQQQWVVGRHAPGSVAKPGEAKYFWRIVGTTHGCVAVGDVENSMTEVWDQDGLWVGRLLDNPDLNAAPASAYTLSGENFAGSLFTNPKTGNVIFYGGGSNNTSIYRIRGWDEFERKTGVISISAQQAQQLSAQVAAEAAREDIAHIRPVPAAIKIDGDLSEWKDTKPLLIKDGDEVRAKVYLGWNSYGLYVAFDVDTKTPWKNTAVPSLAFQGGSSVAVSFGPLSPARKDAAPGDIRIVAAPIDGKNIKIQFMPRVPGEFANGKSQQQPVYETGNGKTTFERVETDGNYVASQLKPDGTGYIVEYGITNDWALMAITKGQKLRFDASVQLSNPDGTKTIARIPWLSKDANDMATDDVFYEATLRPQNWGEARVE